ncbi:MAG: single-stranded DNA-binding protein [Acidimicrobiales bacterium]
MFVNVVVVTGRLSRPAEERVLPSGDRLVALEVTVPGDGAHGPGRSETVPVVWLAAPARAADLDQGETVLAVGRVRRRFWRAAGGGTGSRTEVVAEAVVPLRQARRCRAALIAAVGRAEEALPG